MFKFLRRVSTSFLPGPDRPWREDATSNAPTIGRKRRFSITDHDEEEEFGSIRGKKPRTAAMQLDGVEALTKDSKEGQTDGEGVKSVTQGVKQVDLEDTRDQARPAQPEAIPLPESPSPQLVTLESTQEPGEPQHTAEVSEDNTDVESVQPTEDTRNDTRDAETDESTPSCEREETPDPEEKVQGTQECLETVESHPTDVADTEAGEESTEEET
ncbi:hypothetical protein EDC04DRAFT_3059712 [Pisolithus marmoratus]|nr:hypothetical protein EDC04DRAFT_3059712 [Pisolithus marmoratus]